MAVYEYQCEKCKSTFTITQRISEHEESTPHPKCPECGSKKTHQIFTGFFAKTASKT